MERNQLLDPKLKVLSADVQWHFISNYYDAPVSGLAVMKKEIFRFCCFPEDIPHQHVYVLQRLTEEELAEELRQKGRFEQLVGTHWSFASDGSPLPRILRPDDTAKRYYDEEKSPLDVAPSDRPIVAWFDVATV